MNNILRKLNKIIYSLTINFILFIFILNPTISFAASETPKTTLTDKISKDFTKKFCNSVGFGLSKESAMRFSYEENKQTFKNRKGIENVNINLLAEKIATSVIDNCGYKINLYGDNAVKDFENYYIKIDKK